MIIGEMRGRVNVGVELNMSHELLAGNRYTSLCAKTLTDIMAGVERISNRKLPLMNHFFPPSSPSQRHMLPSLITFGQIARLSEWNFN
jgi:hypothetical protein